MPLNCRRLWSLAARLRPAGILLDLYKPLDPVFLMSQLTDFISHHPLLIGATCAVGVAAAAVELRFRGTGGAAVSPSQAVLLMNAGALTIDVRDAAQFAAGHIVDARNIAAATLAEQAESLSKHREKPVLVYCDSGVTSAAAARTLKSLGFAKAFNLSGGLQAWRQENLPVVVGAAEKKNGKR